MRTLDLHVVNDVYFDKLFVAKNNTALAAAIKGKVLLVDQHTMPIISMSYTQSQLLQHDVILVELLENVENLSTMKHLNCVIYAKPLRSSILLLCAELRSPHYTHYQVFFSNTVAKSDLEKIALADEFEVVNQVMELFLDFLVVNDNLFSISLPQQSRANLTVAEAESLLSLLLAVKKCPVVKYDLRSLDLKRLASEVLYYINSNSNNNLFDDLNRASDVPPVLIILDRKHDPITPLLTPWTYQLMIHELIGVDRNVVSLESSEQLTLLKTQDVFFLESMYLNYGDLTDKFQQYVDEYKKQTKQSLIENLKTQDLSELKKILTRFPEFKKLSNNILKHLNIISELDKQISAENLWAVGELQQTIVCELENAQTIRQKMMDLVASASVSTANKVKLLLLFVSKFPHDKGSLEAFLGKMNDPITTSPPPTVSQINLIRNFNIHYKTTTTAASTAAEENNIGQLFNKNRIKIQQLFNTNANQSLSAMPKTDNIYMQYIPKLNEILSQVTAPAQQRPSQQDLALMIPDKVSAQYGANIDRLGVEEVIVYIKGGITYEEARLVHDLNALNPRISYLVGGDLVLNSKQWVEKMCDDLNGAETESVQPDRAAQLREIL